MPTKVNQQGAVAGGDIIAGDKTTYSFETPGGAGVVEQLLEKLRAEMTDDRRVGETIDRLRHYYTQSANDGVIGLEAKLNAARRGYELPSALAKKELFAKILERWSLYASAQQIFVYLLARAEHEFTMFVMPSIGHADDVTINHIITRRIVEPTIADCGAGILALDHGVAMGMVYWLAEQCFVRWHI